MEMFRSDFKIVAEYFVQMRKNKEYKPTTTQMRHVREVLRLMSLLTKDRRFEDAVNGVGDMEKGAEPKNMCEVLDRVEKRGESRGIEIGKSQGIEIGKNQGIEIGKSQGITIGETKRAKEDALRMKEDGLPLEKISIYVDVDLETVRGWVKESGDAKGDKN